MTLREEIQQAIDQEFLHGGYGIEEIFGLKQPTLWTIHQALLTDLQTLQDQLPSHNLGVPHAPSTD